MSGSVLRGGGAKNRWIISFPQSGGESHTHRHTERHTHTHACMAIPVTSAACKNPTLLLRRLAGLEEGGQMKDRRGRRRVGVVTRHRRKRGSKQRKQTDKESGLREAGINMEGLLHFSYFYHNGVLSAPKKAHLWIFYLFVSFLMMSCFLPFPPSTIQDRNRKKMPRIQNRLDFQNKRSS